MRTLIQRSIRIAIASILLASAFVSNGMESPEGFEGDTSNDWSIEGGVWQIGTSSGAHSGTGLAGTVIGGNYPNNANARLISPEFVVLAEDRHKNLWLASLRRKRTRSLPRLTRRPRSLHDQERMTP